MTAHAGPDRPRCTFWLIDGRQYWVDASGRYHDVDAGTMPAFSLDARPGVQLHLVSTS